MNANEVLKFMRNSSSIPRPGNYREIYEAGDRNGHGNGEYYMTYAHIGGTTERVPRHVIDELVSAGLIVRSFQQQPHINCWRLA